jgi:hypothetical protein
MEQPGAGGEGDAVRRQDLALGRDDLGLNIWWISEEPLRLGRRVMTKLNEKSKYPGTAHQAGQL